MSSSSESEIGFCAAHPDHAAKDGQIDTDEQGPTRRELPDRVAGHDLFRALENQTKQQFVDNMHDAGRRIGRTMPTSGMGVAEKPSACQSA
jgi:hypothetical protein